MRNFLPSAAGPSLNKKSPRYIMLSLPITLSPLPPLSMLFRMIVGILSILLDLVQVNAQEYHTVTFTNKSVPTLSGLTPHFTHIPLQLRIRSRWCLRRTVVDIIWWMLCSLIWEGKTERFCQLAARTRAMALSSEESRKCRCTVCFTWLTSLQCSYLQTG